MTSPHAGAPTIPVPTFNSAGSAIASSSELVEMLIGKTLEEAKAIKNIEIVEALELPPIKIHCSVLAEDSIRQAIEDYESKQ